MKKRKALALLEPGETYAYLRAKQGRSKKDGNNDTGWDVFYASGKTTGWLCARISLYGEVIEIKTKRAYSGLHSLGEERTFPLSHIQPIVSDEAFQGIVKASELISEDLVVSRQNLEKHVYSLGKKRKKFYRVY